MSRRSAQLKAIVENFNRVHKEWADSENRPNPDETYWDAVDALRDTFSEGEIPPDCRQLTDAVNDFLDEVDVFDQRENPNNYYPHDAFWRTRQAIEDCLKAEDVPELPPLEPIAELAKLPNITHTQIAKMWGFTDRNGQPMPHLVQRELNHPGSVINTAGSIDGRDWVDPRIAERNAAKQAAERHLSALERPKDEAPPCKETPQELWEQNLSPKQAAKMLRTSVEEVQRLWDEFEAARLADEAGETPEPAGKGKKQKAGV